MSFTSTASTATSVVKAGGVFEITHAFQPSVSPDLYEVTVTIRNISGAAVANTLYRCTMDRDIEPTAFNEYVTIGGTATAANVIAAVNNGFCSVDPLGPCSPLLPGGVVPEPATWAMMIAGFGLVGFVARRRRTSIATA
ncbi:MAG: PEPxxWA-CTERM sorting domain-containing protein [Sphingomonadaceae bacterium]